MKIFVKKLSLVVIIFGRKLIKMHRRRERAFGCEGPYVIIDFVTLRGSQIKSNAIFIRGFRSFQFLFK